MRRWPVVKDAMQRAWIDAAKRSQEIRRKLIANGSIIPCRRKEG